MSILPSTVLINKIKALLVTNGFNQPVVQLLVRKTEVLSRQLKVKEKNKKMKKTFYKQSAWALLGWLLTNSVTTLFNKRRSALL